MANNSETPVREIGLEEFLDLIWGDEPCYVDVPSKAGGYWGPWIGTWPEDRELIINRIDQCSDGGEDVYFSAARFYEKGRRLVDTMPTHWLWADLDTVDPVFLDEDGVLPTLAWETSFGRYQAMWRLDKEMKPEKQTVLNRALSLAIGADKGGWDLTQVLRPIDTYNWKRPPYDEVELLWYDPDLVYTIADMRDRIRALRRGKPISQRQVEDPTKGLGRWVRNRLRDPESMVLTGERSGMLWKIEKDLARHGLDAEAMFELIWPCAWNKHRIDRGSRGENALRREIQKAISEVAKEAGPEASPKRRTRDVEGAIAGEVDSGADGRGDDHAPAKRPQDSWDEYAPFLSQEIETPRWLIENIWSSASHGIIGGEPKTSKSTFTLAMALSVATGEPFLGIPEYRVPEKGAVLLIQEENAPWVMQDRLRKLAHMYGLLGDYQEVRTPKGSLAKKVARIRFPKDADLFMLNNFGFDLLRDEHLEMLESKIQEVEAKMVIIDPLYLVAAVNLNQSESVAPLLRGLMQLGYKYDCAVAVVHHWSKATETTQQRRSGQRLMGTAFFHGWLESGLYMENVGTGDGKLTVRVEREFRNVAPQDDLEIEWYLGRPGELDLEVRSVKWDPAADIERVLEGVFRRNGDRPINVKTLMSEMDKNGGNGATKEEVAQLVEELGYKVVSRNHPYGQSHTIHAHRGKGRA